jgi:anti-anti-sigma factor
MNSQSTKILVAIVDSLVLIKIQGKANFSVSASFKTVIEELRQKGFIRFKLDLAECPLMDSTFFGVLAGQSLQMTTEASSDGAQKIQLFNTNQRIADALDNMGIAHLFEFCSGVMESANYEESKAGASSKLELTQTSLEAHQTLMSINPSNIAKFKDVAQFLAEDLQKLLQK